MTILRTVPELIVWLVFALMCLAATVFVAWPLYAGARKLSPMVAVSVLLVVGLSCGLYLQQGNPAVPSGPGAAPDVEAMVESLAARLDENPGDLQGWLMLGRSYMTLGRFDEGVTAFERAVELEDSQNAQTLVSLGEAMLQRDQSRIEGRTSALFESALALEPNNPGALFYAGIAALNRGDQALAADRWEILMGLNPPPEIKDVLAQRIAEWRGEPLPAAQPAIAPADGTVVAATVAVAAGAREQLPADASVFIIARDPQQPSPPIAVARRRLSELPDTVSLGDRDSMIPGRALSAFDEFELLARVSVSGETRAQAGDWYGSIIVRPGENNAVNLLIQNQLQ